MGQTQFSTVTTTNTYDDEDIANWWLGRVSTTDVSHYRPLAFPEAQRTINRHSSFTYNDKGMLASEQINGLTTLHCYDYDLGSADVGNESITITHANLADVSCSSEHIDTSDDINKVFRRKRVNYDEHNRYVTSAGNDKFILTTVNSRNDLGLPTQSTDIKGVVTYLAYDAFGRQYFSGNNRGQTSTISRALAASSTSTSGISGAHYVETITSAGKPSVKNLFDKLGRNIASGRQSFDGTSYVMQQSQFDEMGRVVAQSTPYFDHDTPNWHYSLYDDFGRVQSTRAANGVTSDISYSGLTVTTVISPNDGEAAEQINVVTTNMLGETVSVEDNAARLADSSIRYFYNAAGNLTKVIGIDDVAIQSYYDVYGHKTSMDDPDKDDATTNDLDRGDWTYQYNALGELISQTSARDHTSQFTRDSVGRVTHKATTGDGSVEEGVEDSILYHYGSNGNSHLLTSEANNNQTKTYHYDASSRIDRLTTLVDGTSYVQQTTYDQYGRVFQQFDADANSEHGCFDI